MDSFLFEEATSPESLLEKARKVQSQRLDELATNNTQQTNNIQDSLFDHLSSTMVNHQFSQMTETEDAMHLTAVGPETVSMQKFWQNAFTVSLPGDLNAVTNHPQLLGQDVSHLVV